MASTLDGVPADNEIYIAELEETAQHLRITAAEIDSDEFQGPIKALDAVIELVHKSWSGSNLGYHSRTYYENFQPPPADDMFNKEWGLMMSRRQRGWVIYDDDDDVKSFILRSADVTDLHGLSVKSDKARELLLSGKAAVTSIIVNCQLAREDPYLADLRQPCQ
ncbi:hypothetical protein AB4Z39_28845 [Mycobacterium adipatum]|uniref:hypothetical protein n=1 Tax=Mycobacterium adipatum TaxID=1682113 RepID=UPI0034E08E6A